MGMVPASRGRAYHVMEVTVVAPAHKQADVSTALPTHGDRLAQTVLVVR